MNYREEEHEFKTTVALARMSMSPFVTDEDIDLVCSLCGKRREDLQGVKVTGYSFLELRQKFMELMRQTELAREHAEGKDEQ